MNGNQYTQKSIEAIERAQAIAAEYANQTLEQAHLLRALLEAREGLIPQLLVRMGTDIEGLSASSLTEVEKLPRVKGLSREQGKTYVSQDMDAALREASNVAEQMKDEYISVEHLFLALLKKADRALKSLFQRFGVQEAAFL